MFATATEICAADRSSPAHARPSTRIGAPAYSCSPASSNRFSLCVFLVISSARQGTGPHGTCFHVARVVSTPRNWKVSLMVCGNRMCPPGRVSTHSDVQGSANQQTSFSGRDDECVAHKLPFSGHIIKKFRGPSILQLNIEGLTASKMNVLHHLATHLEAFVILLPETHCISAEKLVLSNYH